jgi:flagellar hook-basal body complex protein FliE
MNTIQPLWTEMPLPSLRAEQETQPEKEGSPFTDIFQSAIDAVRTTDAEKTQMEYLMATGQLDNPALLTIASTKAQLSVDLLVQLRNKSMDAYNELMRISL